MDEPIPPEMMPDLTAEQIQEKLAEMGIKGVTPENAAQMVGMYNLVRSRCKELLIVELARIGQEVKQFLNPEDPLNELVWSDTQQTVILQLVATYCEQVSNTFFQQGMLFGKNLTIKGVQDQIAAKRKEQQ